MKVKDIRERRTFKDLNENIISNIEDKREELKKELKDNGGIINKDKSGIFGMMRSSKKQLLMIEPSGDDIEKRYEGLKNILSCFNVGGYLYKSYKMESEAETRYGVMVRADNKESDIIDLDDNSIVRNIDTSNTEIMGSEDAYEIIRSQFDKINSDIVFFEWKYFNHLSWYAFRPFWFRIFDETIMN